jgi:hypothetical protein
MQHQQGRQGPTCRPIILATNVKRRHMTEGQQAMAHAMIYPDAGKGGRGKRSTARHFEHTSTSPPQIGLGRARHTLQTPSSVSTGAAGVGGCGHSGVWR